MGDLGFVLGGGDAGDHNGFHGFLLGHDPGSFIVVEARTDVDAHAVLHAELDRANLQHLGAQRRQLEHLLVADAVDLARKVDRISYEEMLELASLGAKVLQIRSVEFGMKYGVRIHVRSSFNDNEGTWVVPEEKAMEAVVVAGVTATKDEAKITHHGISASPQYQHLRFRPLAHTGLSLTVN